VCRANAHCNKINTYNQRHRIDSFANLKQLSPFPEQRQLISGPRPGVHLTISTVGVICVCHAACESYILTNTETVDKKYVVCLFVCLFVCWFIHSSLVRLLMVKIAQYYVTRNFLHRTLLE
jgi:hypothetical protein